MKNSEKQKRAERPGGDVGMKVVLFALNGSWSHSSLAIRCLRGPLERAGFEVSLVEFTLRDRTSHILERLYAEEGDIYGFSCYIWNLPQMQNLADSLHRIRPGARIIFGGPEVSYGMHRFVGLPYVHAIVSGEGEAALPELCRAMEKGEDHPFVTEGGRPDVMREEGILYRSGEQTGSLLYYESSRGCPYRCAYCLSSATVGVRAKSVEQTLRELLEFEALELPCRVVKFVDRTFNFDVDRANAIWAGLLNECYTKCYHFEVCASLLSEQSFEILAKFPKGKVQLEFGLQSTNPATLAEVSRHIKPEEVISAVRRVHEMGNIHVHLDLIAGLPYEDLASFGRSFDAAWGCCDLLQVGFLKLLFGTRLREQAERYGYICEPEPPYTVLASNWISYPELQSLRHMAEVLERYVESGRFAHTLWLLTPQMTSPFAFWQGLTASIGERDARPLQKLSQPEAYRYLMEYAEESLPHIDRAALREMLALDFSSNEHKNPPRFLTVTDKG